ncbi:hypothetical protein DPMN_080544 [Dreissena polymorpha]|uniref:Uncharacterized protein n=1 Tax=Dreissena polymorpha TaxID=45954 RepID=A0A9D4BR11_DREPO|nr:hypothetical protein DPMN_080544 [Dreissena polymorpha]
MSSFKLDRDFIGTSLLTKFLEDQTINVASRVFTNKCGRTNGGQRPVTKAHLSNQTEKQTNGRTDRLTDGHFDKIHENWAKNVTSRVFTCFHYIHIEKNAPPTGGHVFSPIWTIFELVREIKKTQYKTAPPTGGHVFHWTETTFELKQHIIKTNILTNFELDRDFIGTKLLTKFHEHRTINVASRVFTNKC